MKSPIEKIHDKGLRAIIDGNKMMVVGTCSINEVDSKIAELENKYPSVGEDGYGDIIFYTDLDDD